MNIPRNKSQPEPVAVVPRAPAKTPLGEQEKELIPELFPEQDEDNEEDVPAES